MRNSIGIIQIIPKIDIRIQTNLGNIKEPAEKHLQKVTTKLEETAIRMLVSRLEAPIDIPTRIMQTQLAWNIIKNINSYHL